MERVRRLRALGFKHGRYQSKFVVRNAPKTKHTKTLQYGCVWESLFMRKTKAEKRELIRRPWELPMAAQHLAAILLQKRVRGLLARLHLRDDIFWRPYKIGNPQHYRIVVRSPMQRFIHEAHGSFSNEAGFHNFVATLLQAWYRQHTQRWRYAMQRFPVFQIAALQVQYTWRAHCQQRLYLGAKRQDTLPVPLHTRAALSLQTAWKAYTNRRIFRYYRDLIMFRNTGDPAMMLRAINPGEASLLDASVGAHVRFRLGGMSFPPTIYYKIFTRRAVCDLNAFSPKDYTISRQVGPRSHSHDQPNKHNKKSAPQNGGPPLSSSSSSSSRLYIRVGNSYFRAQTAAEDTRYWYKRMENNGWRPVTAKVLSEANSDPVALTTAKKVAASFHHSTLVRKQDREQLRRLKKRQWMHKLYTQGLLRESPATLAMIHDGAGHRDCDGGDSGDDEIEGYATTARMSDLQRHPSAVFDVDFDHEDWEEDANEMFEWASALDFDEYVADWQELGKTASTDVDTRLVQPSAI